jgi:beta-aspartyl-peptidase (threonine type)
MSKMSKLVQQVPEFMSTGTVGAVARDKAGKIATATSTGGLALRLPGRIGGTPLIGSGTYANEAGGCSVTGIGEGAIRLAVAKTACDLIQRGSSPQKAAERSVQRLQNRHLGKA